MTICAVVKMPGKRSHLTSIPIEIQMSELSLEQLITCIVTENVKAFNSKKTNEDITKFLTKEEIATQEPTGKIGFGRRFGTKKADVKKSVDAALLAFCDNLYRVFVDEEEATCLQDQLRLRENSEVAFIRFTFLSGTMW